MTVINGVEVKPYEGFTGIDFNGVDFNGVDCRGVAFRGCDFSRANFRGANLEGTSFLECNFSGTKWAGANARYTSFNRNTLRKVDFRGACFDCGQFQDCDIREARFDGCGMQLARLEGANARFASFCDALMVGASFGSADCQSADFRNAVLIQATVGSRHGSPCYPVTKFKGADFRGADLSGVSLYRCDYKGAKADSSTITTETFRYLDVSGNAAPAVTARPEIRAMFDVLTEQWYECKRVLPAEVDRELFSECLSAARERRGELVNHPKYAIVVYLALIGETEEYEKFRAEKVKLPSLKPGDLGYVSAEDFERMYLPPNVHCRD